jgi:hypothetical protein
MQFLLPYDKKRIPVEIDDRSFAGALVSKVESYKPGLSPTGVGGSLSGLYHRLSQTGGACKGQKKHCHYKLGPHPSRAF